MATVYARLLKCRGDFFRPDGGVFHYGEVSGHEHRAAIRFAIDAERE